MSKNGHKRSKKPSDRPLTTMQRAFAVDHAQRLTIGKPNGVKSAQAAGYKGTPAALSVQAFQNLRHPKIVALVEELSKDIQRPITGVILSSHEVLAGVSAIARNTIADILDDQGRFSMAKARETGAIHQVRRITYHKDGTTIHSVEMDHRKIGFDLMGRYYRLWDRGGYSALEDDQEKSRQLLAKLTGTQPHLLPPANPMDVEGELVIDEDTKVAMDKEQ